MRVKERGAYVGGFYASDVRLSKPHRCTQAHQSAAPTGARAALSSTNTTRDRSRTSAVSLRLSEGAELLHDLHSDVGSGLLCQ
jgi:hypothetical protein